MKFTFLIVLLMNLILNPIKVNALNVQKDSKTKETESISALNLPKDAKLTVLAPIDHCTKGNTLSLEITIPPSLKSITATENFWEFIPSEESADNWSEIFTVRMLLGLGEDRARADHFNEFMLKTMKERAKNVELLSLNHEDKKEPTYRVSNFAIVYENNGQKELLLCVAYSGPMDLTNIQMTRKLKANDQPEMVLKEMQKELFERIIQIVPYKTDDLLTNDKFEMIKNP